MAKKTKSAAKRPIESYDHRDKQRVNNPPAGLVTPDTDVDAGPKAYAYDPHLDPQLVWAGKAEHTSFEVPTVSLHVHERIDPRTIVEAARKRNGEGGKTQRLLFDMAEENPPLREAIEFYKHAHGWSNRLAAGDSLLVMNSLLEKEGMAGKVQMVYLDPPYGIRYGSNFQPFVNKRDVKDGRDDDLTAEPEQIRAFRDTWELGIHSYLAYLRDRLLLARELLTESGSVFVQISDENVHHVRELMDEVFGAGNFVSLITAQKTTSSTNPHLSGVADYLLWYALKKQSLKFRELFSEKTSEGDGTKHYNMVELADGTRRSLTAFERGHLETLPEGSRLFTSSDLQSASMGRDKGEGAACWFDVRIGGNIYRPNIKSRWKTNEDGMKRLICARRALGQETALRYVRYLDDFSAYPIHNIWGDLGGASDRIYVVQTNRTIIQRCLLMTTDPGDLVFDPTCGSGTTAYVAGQWGRRWITCDTSRVALTLARQRLMTAVYDYYELAHPDEGVGSGFKYKTVPHITLKCIANNPDIREGMTREEIDAAIARHAPQETLYDQPLVDRKKKRVTGPFTVEAVPAPAVQSIADALTPALTQGERQADGSVARSGETLRQDEWRDELMRAGIRGKAGQRIGFARLEPLPGCRWLHADGESRPSNEGADRVKENGPSSEAQRIVVSFGPEHAPLEARQVAQAIEEAQTLVPRPKLIVFAAFQFDSEAAKDIDATNWPGVALLKAQMNADMLTDDLKKKRASNESFWLIGQPDMAVLGEEWVVNSKKEALAPYRVLADLSGLERLEEMRALGQEQLSLLIAIAQRRDLWDAAANDKEGGINDDKRRRGAGAARNGGGSPVSGLRGGLPVRIGDAADFARKLDPLSEEEFERRIGRLQRNREIADRAAEIAASLSGELATVRYCQVSVEGFDYYNTKTGGVESGSADQIAVWLLDTDYDGRSLYPRQVFFPMAGAKEGWARLGRNLKAEIDEDLIEAYRGTVSLPFEPSEHGRIAVKIVDDRGIESLKVMEAER